MFDEVVLKTLLKLSSLFFLLLDKLKSVEKPVNIKGLKLFILLAFILTIKGI